MRTPRSGQGGRDRLGKGLSSWHLPKLGLSSLLNNAWISASPSPEQSLSPGEQRTKQCSRMSPMAQLGKVPVDQRGQLCSWQEMKGQHRKATQAGIEICGVAALSG